MRRSSYRFASVSLLGLLFAIAVGAQVPRIDPKAGQRVIVVTDDNFVVQKPTGPVLRRSITCEAWITTDGKLHCRTTAKLMSASVKFTAPTISSPSAEDGTTVGSSISRKLTIKQPVLGQDTYTWDISGDKYRQMHSITLSIAHPLGSGSIVLINKKVPAAISK